MPAYCPHCNQLVAIQPECPNCGKSMQAAAAGRTTPSPAAPAADERPVTMRDMSGVLAVLVGVLVGLVVLFVLCIVLLVFLVA